MLENIVSKKTYPANAETDRKWKKAVEMSKFVPGKYGAITLKVSK